MSTGYRTARAAIADEAAAWVVQIDDGALDLAARGELLVWLRNSPQHVEEFLMVTAAWQELDEIDVEHRLDVDQLIAETKQNVVILGAGQEADTTGNDEHADTAKQRNWRQWVAAAVVLLVLGSSLLVRSPPPQPEFATDVGQQLTFTLKDGSVVQLNTQSAMDTRFTDNERKVTLLKGEAMFEVAKDSTRPFRVHSGSVIIEAIGTRFNVYRREDATTVTVEEGSVSVLSKKARKVLDPLATKLGPGNEQQVAMLVLKAGEEAQALGDGSLVQIKEPDFEKSSAWRDRRVVFRSDSLERVAEEFNRYNWQKIVIQVPSKISRDITGTFDATDPKSFIAFLEKDASLEVIHYAERIVVRPARITAH